MLRRAAVFFGAVLALIMVLSALLLWGMAHLLGLLSVPFRWGEIGLATVMGLLALVMVVAAARSFHRTAAPIEALMAALGRIADGDYSARVEWPARREPGTLLTLIRAFNAMADRLQRQEKQRRALFMDISHELRTPLTVLQGTLEGMLDGVYPRDDAHLGSIVEETAVLARLVEDIRMLALAESAGLTLAKTPADVAEIARDALASIQTQAEAAGVSVEFAAETGLPLLDVDPERIRQVLNNLLSNALRYTPAGGVIRVRYASGDSDHAVLTVQDTGPGISPDDLPHIFDRFYKSPDSHGTGLGLAIAKNLVQAHDGEISAETAAGSGTTIRVALPLRRSS